MGLLGMLIGTHRAMRAAYQALNAAMDARAEYDLHLRFKELTRGRATLLVSHRFSTVRMADRIVVLEDGRIKELGTHAELVALGGTYADLYERQASHYR